MSGKDLLMLKEYAASLVATREPCVEDELCLSPVERGAWTRAQNAKVIPLHDNKVGSIGLNLTWRPRYLCLWTVML